MKAKDIKVGGTYTARVSGRLVKVKVDGIREVHMSPRSFWSRSLYSTKTVYDVTNLATGRKLTFKSAAKFRMVEREQEKKLAAAKDELKYFTDSISEEYKAIPTKLRNL